MRMTNFLFRKIRFSFPVIIFCAVLQTAAIADELPEGYRGLPYKAPTPWTAPGAATLSFSEEVQELIAETDVVLVNVSPVTLGPEGEDGTRTWIPRRDKQMYNIPGSVWMPNVGYQSLDTPMQDYFKRNMERLTEGNLERPVLFYCTADCWMSWNAVKRAIEELGYTNVYWYPLGIDGWKEVDLALELAEPIPYLDATRE